MLSAKKALQELAERIWPGISIHWGKQPQETSYMEMQIELLKAVDEQTRKVRETVYVRPFYLVSLNPAYIEDISSGEFQAKMEEALTEDVRNHINERGYSLNSQLSIRLRSDDRLESGLIGITAAWREGDPNRPDFKTVRIQKKETLLTLRVSQSGQMAREIRLTRLPAIIGRDVVGTDVDVPIDDPQNVVSRKHICIERIDGIFYISDMKSSNQTDFVGIAEPMEPEKKYVVTNNSTLVIADNIKIEVQVPVRNAVDVALVSNF